MDLDIRKNVLEKIKNDDQESIKNTINEAVNSNDEMTLPGLGVMLEIFWNDLNNEEQNNITNIIKRKIN